MGLVDRLIKTSNVINKLSRKGSANYIIFGSQVASQMQKMFDIKQYRKNRINEIWKF